MEESWQRSVHKTEVKILPYRPNDDEPNLILLKFACPLYFFSHQLFGTYRNKYCYMKTVNDFAF